MLHLESLNALTQSQEQLLCGRADVIREIVDNCRAQRLTVLTSEPGAGITSLLQAGIVPALRRQHFTVALFSDWQGHSFAANFKDAISNAAPEAADPLFVAQREPLDRVIENTHARSGEPVAILLDQFEDYLRCHSNSVLSDIFDGELAHLISSHQAVFVIALQDHAIPAFERLGQYIANLLGFQIVLPLLDLEAAKQAVVSQASELNLEVEPAALDALTTAPVVAPEAAKVHPFFLKVATGVLLETEARLKSPVLRAATIEAKGGVDRIVLESLDARIGELKSAQTELLYRWCNVLISPEKQRLAVTEKGLTKHAGKLHRLVPGLLELLTGWAILRSVETPETTRYELSRECFAPILRDWWERREAVVVTRRRLMFRMTSVSVAIFSIVLMYVVWLVLGSTK